MGATSWTEQSQTADGWDEALPEGDNETDYFIDFLFEGSNFFNAPVDWTEHSQSADSWTEHSQSATTFTEIEG